MEYSYKKINNPSTLKKGNVVIYNTTTASAKKKKYTTPERIELVIQSPYDNKKKWIKAKVKNGKNKGFIVELIKSDFENGVVYSRHKK